MKPQKKEIPATPAPHPKKKMAKNKNIEAFYVSGDVLREQIRNFYNTGNFGNELGTSVIKVVDGLGKTSRFSGYSYLDEMKADARLKIIRAVNLKNFRVESETNPFSYFTTIAFHAFCNRIKMEKKYRNTVDSFQDSIYDELISEGFDFVLPEHSSSEFTNL